MKVNNNNCFCGEKKASKLKILASNTTFGRRTVYKNFNKNTHLRAIMSMKKKNFFYKFITALAKQNTKNLYTYLYLFI